MTPPYYEFQAHAEILTAYPTTQGQIHDLVDQIPEFYLSTAAGPSRYQIEVSAFLLAQSAEGAERILERELGNALDALDVEYDAVLVSKVRPWPEEIPVPGE